MSNLTDHAERELKRAGLFDKNSDYGGMLGEAVMALVRVHAEQGHSGFSHALTMDLFNRVANFKTLTPITSAAEEWGQVADPCESEPTGLWQNKRQSSVFSRDGGTTWYDIDAPKAPADSPTDDDDDVLARSGFGGGSSAEPKADAAPPKLKLAKKAPPAPKPPASTWQGQFRELAGALGLKPDAMLEQYCRDWVETTRARALAVHPIALLPANTNGAEASPALAES